MSGTVHINGDSCVLLRPAIFETFVHHLEERFCDEVELLSVLLEGYRCNLDWILLGPGEITPKQFRCIAVAIESIAEQMKKDYAEEYSFDIAKLDYYISRPFDELISLLRADERYARTEQEGLIADELATNKFFKQIGLDEIVNEN